ncbi:hypothetical protein B9J88_05940 [Vibrio sp. V05_P4A8T149]|nr:hypothetical protein B9J88_05940 [Vibrio sp. V05_P4A8T149]OXX28100.1 hypothetical protein B9J95_17275 [Vibrio sp. V14_P6S14T42]OXX35133.1 hypothetical protein B9J81_08295 [Vibrio sp. V04_P4A5T148]OXX52857.1 hypothetical protein B9J91_14425 [Vibrio sp. V18_P1S4T112]
MKTDKLQKLTRLLSRAAIVALISLNADAAILRYTEFEGGILVTGIEMNVAEFELGNNDFFSPWGGHTAVNIYDQDKNIVGFFVCSQPVSHKNTLSELTKLPRDDPRWRQYFIEVVGSLNECNGLPAQIRSQYSPSLIQVNITDDGVTSGPGVSVPFLPVDGHGTEPTNCDADIPEFLRFGDVSNSGSHRTETNLLLKCPQKIAFDVQVNYGQAFSDPETGTRITFEDFSTGSLTLDCKDGCTVQIVGEMTAAPTKPGKYQWAVPVIVEYK